MMKQHNENELENSENLAAGSMDNMTDKCDRTIKYTFEGRTMYEHKSSVVCALCNISTMLYFWYIVVWRAWLYGVRLYNR